MKHILLLIACTISLFAQSQCDSSFVYYQTFNNAPGRYPIGAGTTLSYDDSSLVVHNEGILTNELGGANTDTYWDSLNPAGVCDCTKRDHTGGFFPSRMLVANSPSDNPFFTLTIDGLPVPNAYKFGYFGINIHKAGDRQTAPVILVKLYDNVVNSLIDSFTVTFPFVSSWIWAEYNRVIFPVNSVIRVEFSDLETSDRGNDFAIDDIYLQKICMPVLSLNNNNALQQPQIDSREKPERFEVYDIIGRLIYKGKSLINYKPPFTGHYFIRQYYKHRIVTNKRFLISS